MLCYGSGCREIIRNTSNTGPGLLLLLLQLCPPPVQQVPVELDLLLLLGLDVDPADPSATKKLKQSSLGEYRARGSQCALLSSRTPCLQCCGYGIICSRIGPDLAKKLLEFRNVPMLFQHIWKNFFIYSYLIIYRIKKKNLSTICHFIFHTADLWYRIV